MTEVNLLVLPDEIIVHILEYLPVGELLVNVSKVCIRLWTILRQNPKLYSYVTFEDCFEIDEQTLILLTYKTQSLRLLELGHQFYTTSIGRFDKIINSLENACQLRVLDLTDCPLSDLSFLNKLHNLES